jgi:drug/metabolite transporter, DME family
LVAALLFSTGGAAIKASSLTSWQIASFRSGVAALALCFLMPRARRGWTWRTLITSIAYAFTLVFFVLATKYTTAANAIFLQSTAPFYLLLLGPLLLKEPITRTNLSVIALVGTGASLLPFAGQTVAMTAPDPARGNIFGALSGISWALTLAGLRWLGRRESGDDSGGTVLLGNVLACVGTLAFALPVRQASAVDLAAILYLGIFQIGLAYVALTRSMRQVPALEASTLLLVEPVFNPIWTWLVHGERPTLGATLCGMLIIFGAFAGVLRRNAW